MPAKKPVSLHNGHATRAEKDARVAREGSLSPEGEISTRVPSRLNGHKIAEDCWRRLMCAYGEIKATVITTMDLDLLVDYCILTEQVTELDELRKAAFAAWKKLDEKWSTVEEELHGKDLLAAIAQLQSAFTDVVKLDGRVDRKRDLLVKLRQSLYLTPRARAGVAPAAKEKEEPLDPLEQLLDGVVGNVNEFVNGPGDEK